MSGKEHLLELIEKDTHKHIELLQSLIRVASPNPPGDTREAIKVVCRYLDSHGIPNKLIAPTAESPNLVSVLHGEGQTRTGCSAPSLVLNGHIDEFPVGDAEQ